MTWATSVPILVFLVLSVLDLGPMYATDRQTSSDVRRASLLNASALWKRGIINTATAILTVGNHTWSRLPNTWSWIVSKRH